MAQEERKAKHGQRHSEQMPDWLRTIQVNSWEAELLISALFLYILFQIPDFLETYRKVNFSSSDPVYVLIGFFRDAIEILSIGYVVHIIARGIWVANVGLTYVFPKGIDLKKIPLKGRFRKEIEKDTTLGNSVLQLEKIASITYAVSFMCSGLMLSAGIIFLILFLLAEWALKPAMASGNGWVYMSVVLGLLTYILIVLIVFIDFLTNGYFRRDSWASKPYYYIAIAFRYLTFSFIYNRTLLAILSSLPRWQAHLIPFVFVGFLVGYKYVKEIIADKQKEEYYENTIHSMRYENYENLRSSDTKLFVTIQNDLISDGVIKLFVNDLEEFSDLYFNDSLRKKNWNALETPEMKWFVEKYLVVKIDSLERSNLSWHRYKHPVSYSYGYLTFLDLSGVSPGSHSLRVSFDTAMMQPKQVEYLLDQRPVTIVQANIPFYLTK